MTSFRNSSLPVTLILCSAKLADDVTPPAVSSKDLDEVSNYDTAKVSRIATSVAFQRQFE